VVTRGRKFPHSKVAGRNASELMYKVKGSDPFDEMRFAIGREC